MTTSLGKTEDAVGFFIECGKCQVLMRPLRQRPSVHGCPTCGHQVVLKKVRLYRGKNPWKLQKMRSDVEG